MRDRRSGVFEVVPATIPDRLVCDAHPDHFHRECLGCEAARAWRRTYEREARDLSPYAGWGVE